MIVVPKLSLPILLLAVSISTYALLNGGYDQRAEAKHFRHESSASNKTSKNSSSSISTSAATAPRAKLAPTLKHDNETAICRPRPHALNRKIHNIYRPGSELRTFGMIGALLGCLREIIGDLFRFFATVFAPGQRMGLRPELNSCCDLGIFAFLQDCKDRPPINKPPKPRPTKTPTGKPSTSPMPTSSMTTSSMPAKATSTSPMPTSKAPQSIPPMETEKRQTSDEEDKSDYEED